MKSQKQAVLSYLSTGAGITSQYAFTHLGITRISAVIYNLVKEGHEIQRVDVPIKSHFGKTTKIGRWYLGAAKPEPKQQELSL
jgi:hypothetical protein